MTQLLIAREHYVVYMRRGLAAVSGVHAAEPDCSSRSSLSSHGGMATLLSNQLPCMHRVGPSDPLMHCRLSVC